MTVVPLPPHGEWLPDARDGERALRATWHLDAGCVVVSTWREGRCTGTARLGPAEAARLVVSLTDGLARLAATPADTRDAQLG